MAKTSPKRVLLDSSAIIAWIQNDPRAARIAGLMDMLERGDAQLVESVIVLAEVYKRSVHPDEVERHRQDALLNTIRAKLESPDVVLLDVTPPVARKATELRMSHRMKLADATHLATALLNRCDWFVTLDSDFPRLDSLQVFNMSRIASADGLPWDLPVQGDLFDPPSNVISMSTRGRPDS